jgi:hypothetical protein
MAHNLWSWTQPRVMVSFSSHHSCKHNKEAEKVRHIALNTHRLKANAPQLSSKPAKPMAARLGNTGGKPYQCAANSQTGVNIENEVNF